MQPPLCTTLCLQFLPSQCPHHSCCQSKQYSEWQLPLLARTATKFQLQTPLILYGVLGAWVSAHNAGATMWLHCPGHSAEQESDSVPQTVSSSDQCCPPFASPLFPKHSSTPETPTRLSTHYHPVWATELQVLAKEHWRLTTWGHAAWLNPRTHLCGMTH